MKLDENIWGPEIKNIKLGWLRLIMSKNMILMKRFYKAITI